MRDARWTTRIGVRHELRAALAFAVGADMEIACNEIDLLPVLMHEGPRRKGARLEPQQPRSVPCPRSFIERAGEDFLLYARRVALRPMPVRRSHVDGAEFLVLLVDCHGAITGQRVGDWRVPRQACSCRASGRPSG